MMHGIPINRHKALARAWSLGARADDYRAKGRYREAESLFRQAIAMAEEVCEPDDLGFSALLNNLAVLYKYTGQFDEAEQLYRRSLAITERSLGNDHTDEPADRDEFLQVRAAHLE